ncbi:TonB-dependent receptor domain-containing protein [Sphingomonas psychrolutea]|uniref:TonB-dependent receptor domain-containing protein n=1 Tax=Sphingomonas psychrolutea TaxID=1259676 RepID=UPI00166595AC|nr:TonB-dependent receptor [Sphingomonas psychrolutea]
MRHQRYLAECGFSALALGLATPALAQTTTPAPSTATSANAGPDIVVTGSLIRGSRKDGAIPIDVISSADTAKQGSPSLVELLKALPTSNGVLGDSNQFDSRSQGAEGIATINLRGLGPQRTLVLLNSKRLVSAGNGIPSVDINLIPQAAIGRIEILKDGAAATYGSDAVAGVVNFFTRTEQEGFLVSGSYKLIKNDPGDYDISASYGHHGNGFRVLVAAGYQTRGELLARDRKFAIRPYTDNPEGGFTGGGNPATFLALGPTGAPITGLQPDASCAVVGGFVTALNRCATQYSAYDSLVDTERRGQAYVEVGIDVAPNIEFEISALYGRSTVPHYRTSPSYILTQSPSSVSGITQSGFFVPTTNPGLIQYRAQNPTAIPATSIGVLFPTLLYRPFLAGGNPLFASDPNDPGASVGSRKSESERFTAQLSGKLTGALDFNINATYHHYYRYIDGFDSFGDRVQLALRGLGGPNCNITANTPGLNGCQYLNPFGNAIQSNLATGAANPNYVASVANTADLAQWFFVKSFSATDTSLFVAEASISGRTGLTLPGGDVQFGVGGQYRRETYSVLYGNNNNLALNPCRESPVTGNIGACTPNQGSLLNPPATGALAFLGTNRNAKASGDVFAGYGEIQAPIFDSLNVQLSARYERYSGNVGSTFDPQGRIRFQATPWLAFRAGAGTTFRGPRNENLDPGSVTSLQLIGTSFRPVDVFGNVALKPESSTNYSGGVLLKFGGFNASVDYFRYELTNSIVFEPVAGIVNTLFANAANCADPAFAALRQRFQFNDGGGVSGAGTCRVANISRLRTQVINGAGVKNSGLDFAANYRGDFGNVRFGIGANATYTIEYKTADQSVEGVIVQRAFDAAGKLNFQTTAYPVPKIKGQAYIDLGAGIFDGRLSGTYIDSYHDQRADTNSGPFRPREDLPGNPTLLQGANIPSFFTADFTLRVKLPHRTTLSLSVLNIFDRDPSFARLDYNYDPFTGSALKRNYKLGLSSKF